MIRRSAKKHVGIRASSKSQSNTPPIIVSADDFVTNPNQSSNFFRMTESISSDAMVAVKKKIGELNDSSIDQTTPSILGNS
jgi:hypothetical protein